MKSKEIAGTVCAEDEKIPRNELVAAIIENLCKLYQDLPDKSFMEDYRKWSNVSGKRFALQAERTGNTELPLRLMKTVD